MSRLKNFGTYLILFKDIKVLNSKISRRMFWKLNVFIRKLPDQPCKLLLDSKVDENESPKSYFCIYFYDNNKESNLKSVAIQMNY